MKTLYVSDLDGTLLSPEAKLSHFARDTLQEMSKQGLLFSVATARTAATVSHLMRDVPLNIPVLLMNGACLYHPQQKAYLACQGLPKASCQLLLDSIEAHKLEGFCYAVDNGKLSTLYEKAESESAKRFMVYREKNFGKKFTQVKCFRDHLSKNIVYYSISEAKEKLQPVHDRLSLDPNLKVHFYQDIYEKGQWYLEIADQKASKYHGLMALRKWVRAEKVISFGDNLNDLPMFEASDHAIAVANAHPAVKSHADEIINSNADNGVAQWLREHALQNCSS